MSSVFYLVAWVNVCFLFGDLSQCLFYIWWLELMFVLYFVAFVNVCFISCDLLYSVTRVNDCFLFCDLRIPWPRSTPQVFVGSPCWRPRVWGFPSTRQSSPGGGLGQRSHRSRSETQALPFDWLAAPVEESHRQNLQWYILIYQTTEGLMTTVMTREQVICTRHHSIPLIPLKQTVIEAKLPVPCASAIWPFNLLQ